MESEVVNSALSGSVETVHLSVWGLFWAAHWIVKLVILILLFASVWCWAIIFYKLAELRRTRSRSAKFEDSFWSGGSLDDLYDQIGQRPSNPMSAVFSAAMREWRRSLSRRRAGSRDGSDRGLLDVLQ